MPLYDDIIDLIDNPRETPRVEYKREIDLTEVVSKAHLARHLAALANHGGGYIIYGINNDMSQAATTEFPLLTHDSVSGIVNTYLEPPFHCEVRVVTASSGARHTVIIVPAHGAIPICAKKGGPQDRGGAPEGIRSGIYYIRKPGPKSEPITKPDEWMPVIRRCALNERASILGAIDMALRGGSVEDVIDSGVRKWHESLVRAYSERMNAAGQPGLPSTGCIQFSFSIHQSGNEINISQLLNVVEACNIEVDSVTRVHWGPFAIINNPLFWPRSKTATDLNDGETEFLEAAIISGTDTTSTADLWRISPDGMGSLIKRWWEDTPIFGQVPGYAFSPVWLGNELGGFVLFARAFATKFETATAVTFRCEWTGIQGRRPYDPQGRWFTSGHVAEQDRRVATATVSLPQFNNSWETTAAKLAGPLVRAFGLGHVINATWFSDQARMWANRR